MGSSQPVRAKITPEEADRLFLAYARDRSEALRNKIVEAYLYIASIIASKFSGRGVDYDDLYQVASLSLVKAVERFDLTKGVKFVSFATPTMVGEVKNFFRDRSRLIRMPRSSSELLRTIERAKDELTQRLMRSPTAEELAEYADLSADDVLEAMEISGALNPMSLDATLENDVTPFQDLLGYTDTAYGHFEDQQQIEQMLSRLSAIERTVLVSRFFKGLSQRDIADRIGVSQMTVSRIERRALAAMREDLFKD